MWVISKQTRYALRALHSLAVSYGKGPRLVSELAREESIPIFFLQKTLFALKRDGIVDSRVGPAGGYQLRHPPECITLASVIRSIEGTLAPLPCAGENGDLSCDECPHGLACGTRIVMRRVYDVTAKILDQVTLADIIYGEDTEGRSRPDAHPGHLPDAGRNLRTPGG